jgi:hypothetical protein
MRYYKHQCPGLQNVNQNWESDYEWCSEIGMKGRQYEFKVLPSIIYWEGVRKIMTNEFRIQTGDECKARHVACSNLLVVHIAMHPPSAKR